MPEALRTGRRRRSALCAACLALLAGPVLAQPLSDTWLLSVSASGSETDGDARTVYDLFTGPLGVPTRQARVLAGEDGRLAEIMRAFEWLGGAGPEDQIVIHFAGEAETRELHGGHFGVLRPLSAMRGAEDISMQRLGRMLALLPARRVLVLLDVGIGGTETRPAGDGAEAVTRHLLVAAGRDEAVGREGGSALTAALREALADGSADADGDGQVGATELAAYLVPAVALRTDGRQHPFFRAFAEGAGEVTLPVSTGGRAASLPAVSPPPLGTLRVEIDVVGATVWRDGVVVGRAPFGAVPVASGEGWVEIEAPGYQPWARPVYVGPGEELTLRPALVAAEGRLALGPLPDGAVVLVDGAAVDGAGEGVFPLPTGRHEVEVQVPGRPTARRTVTVPPAATVPMEYRSRGFRSGYLLRSAAVPGWGQWADGQPLKAAALFGGLAAAIAFERTAHAGFRSEGDAYEAARVAYLEAASEEDAIRFREAMGEQYEAVEAAQGRHATALVTVAAAYALNLLDAYFNHARRPELVPGRPAFALAPFAAPEGGAGVSLTLRLR